MKTYDEWLSEQTKEDIEWLLKVYGSLTKAYEKYQYSYLAECKDGC